MSLATEPPRLGVQLGIRGYGIFGSLPERDLPAALGHVAGAGAEGVEVMSNLLDRPDRLAAATATAGLVVSGVHVFWPELAGHVVDAVAALGAPYLVVSCVPVGTAAECEAAVDPLLGWAQRAAAAGARLLVHNHAEECARLPDGRTPLGILAERTPPESVGFLVDLFWAMRGSADTDELFEQLRGRCPCIHLKDGPAGEQGSGISHGLGDGDVPLIAGYAAAVAHNRLDWAVIERDQPARDPGRAVDADMAFLTDLLDLPTPRGRAGAPA
jgi:sugar phosphate isomerase/epimerase